MARWAPWRPVCSHSQPRWSSEAVQWEPPCRRPQRRRKLHLWGFGGGAAGTEAGSPLSLPPCLLLIPATAPRAPGHLDAQTFRVTYSTRTSVHPGVSCRDCSLGSRVPCSSPPSIHTWDPEAQAAHPPSPSSSPPPREQVEEATQVPMDRQMCELQLGRPRRGARLSRRQEQGSGTCCPVDEPRAHDAHERSRCTKPSGACAQAGLCTCRT